MLSVPTGFYILVCGLAVIGLGQCIFALGYAIISARSRVYRRRHTLEHLRRVADARERSRAAGVL